MSSLRFKVKVQQRIFITLRAEKKKRWFLFSLMALKWRPKYTSQSFIADVGYTFVDVFSEFYRISFCWVFFFFVVFFWSGYTSRQIQNKREGSAFVKAHL